MYTHSPDLTSRGSVSVRITVSSCQMFVLRMLLHSAGGGGYLRRIYSRGKLRGECYRLTYFVSIHPSIHPSMCLLAVSQSMQRCSAFGISWHLTVVSSQGAGLCFVCNDSYYGSSSCRINFAIVYLSS